MDLAPRAALLGGAIAVAFALSAGGQERAPAAAPTEQSAKGDWPQWRGPGGLGVADDPAVMTEWSPTTNIAWKTAIAGRGHSSPIVSRGRIFLTTSHKGEHVPGRKAPVHLGFDRKPGYVHPDSVDVDYKHALEVLAIDAATGRRLWQRTAYDGLMADDRHRKNTYASSTMATDGTLVYAFFESAGIYAYDFDGNLRWKRSLGDIIKAGLGPGSSPILFEHLLILQCDQEMGDGSFIVALDKKTGEQVWRVDRSSRRSWATPIVVRTSERAELITAAAEVTIAYDPATGRELWRADGVQSHPIPSYVAGHGLVFATAGSQAKRALAIRLGGSGDLTNSSAVVWRYNKGTAYVPSPILHGRYLYLMTDAGIMTCLDALTGALMYEGGRVPVPATFTASIVAAGDVLLLTSEDGDTFVVRAGPKHEVLRTNTVGEAVYASPAIADGRLYIRGERHLFAIGGSAREVLPGPGRDPSPSTPVDEARAVAFLRREVPRWKAENDCYSCHNNGDAARALLVAASRGHDVGSALDDTLDWLRQPQKWNHNQPAAPPGRVEAAKPQGGVDDKPLARVQFGGALRLAVDRGRASRAALAEAAAIIAADQKPDGSWQLDTSHSLGSPATYGTTLATTAARQILVASERGDLGPAIGKADAWLRAVKVDTVIDAAAVVLGLGHDRDAVAQAQRQRALSTLQRGQAQQGGWGPFVTVGPEVFDTSLVVLALTDLRRRPDLAAPVYSAEQLTQAIARAREYLLREQLTDGSWTETTRPSGQESYAQRISTTGWALLALLESRP
jgi:outer membrane protein assembly factor BamB